MEVLRVFGIIIIIIGVCYELSLFVGYALWRLHDLRDVITSAPLAGFWVLVGLAVFFVSKILNYIVSGKPVF